MYNDDIDNFSISRVNTADGNLYRRYYFRNPCVPFDFLSINEALKQCPRMPSSWMHHSGDEGAFYSTACNVVLMPGVYEERIYIGGEPAVGQSFNNIVAIRAAFPMLGATISSLHEERGDGVKDKPCIAISTCDCDALEGVRKEISVRLSHLRVLHSSLGADIWGGNIAILVEGLRAQVEIESCVLQSDSGRRLVVTNQAVAEV